MTDNMLTSLSFLFTLEHVHIRMKELFSASFVHLVLFIAKNGKNYEDGNENLIKYEIIYLWFKWEP